MTCKITHLLITACLIVTGTFVHTGSIASPKNSNDLYIDVYIDKILSDKFSDSFYSDPGNDLFTSVIKRVNEYFTTCGWNHNLPTIDVYIKLNKGSLDIKKYINRDYSKIERNHFEVYYLDKKEFVDKYVLSPLGKRTRDGRGSGDIEIIQTDVEEGKTFIFAKNIHFNYLVQQLRGYADPFKRIVFVFPFDKEDKYDDMKMIRYHASVICHEIGHLFGLQHPKDREFGDFNLMNSKPKWEVNTDIRNNYLRKSQVEKIFRYLRR
jgi:hypothetical protein